MEMNGHRNDNDERCNPDPEEINIQKVGAGSTEYLG